MTTTDQVFKKRTSCPACGKSNFIQLFKLPYTDPGMHQYIKRFYPLMGTEQVLLEGNTYDLVECENCDLIFQQSILTDEYITALYTRWISHSDALAISENNIEAIKDYFTEFLRLQSRVFKNNEFTIYDFGCGWAKWLQAGMLFGAKAKGFDIDPVRCDYARERGIEIADIYELKDNSINFISVRAVFEHLVHPMEVMAQLYPKLKPGGVFKFSVPSSDKIHDRINALHDNFTPDNLIKINEIAPLEHINTYTHKTIVKMGQSLGLKPIYFTAAEYFKAGIFVEGGGLRTFNKFILPFKRASYQYKSNEVFLMKG